MSVRIFEKPLSLVRAPRTEAAQAPQVMFGTVMLFLPSTVLLSTELTVLVAFGESCDPPQPTRTKQPREQSLIFINAPKQVVFNRVKTPSTR